MYLANRKVRNENYDDNSDDEDADDDGDVDHDRDNEDDERGDDDMDGDRVLDGLPGGHPDELALLSQIAAARPEVLTIFISLIKPQTLFSESADHFVFGFKHSSNSISFISIIVAGFKVKFIIRLSPGHQ